MCHGSGCGVHLAGLARQQVAVARVVDGVHPRVGPGVRGEYFTRYHMLASHPPLPATSGELDQIDWPLRVPDG